MVGLIFIDIIVTDDRLMPVDEIPVSAKSWFIPVMIRPIVVIALAVITIVVPFFLLVFFMLAIAGP